MATETQANETQFNQNYYSSELTQFANTSQGNEDIEKALNFAAPIVFVARRFEYKKIADNDTFYSESDDIRTIGSGFKHIDFNGETVQAKTFNKGLTVRVDTDDIAGGDWEARYVYALKNRLCCNEYRRTIKAFVETIKAAQKKAKKQIVEPEAWAGEKAQPDADLRNAILTARSDYGFSPNRLLFSEGAWYLRQNYYASQDDTAGAHIAAELSREALAEKLLVENVQLIKQVHLGLQGKELEGDEIFAFYAQNGLLKDEPSAVKRFVTPFDDGHLFRVYVEPHTKYTDITVEHYSNIVVTSATNILQIKVKGA